MASRLGLDCWDVAQWRRCGEDGFRPDWNAQRAGRGPLEPAGPNGIGENLGDGARATEEWDVEDDALGGAVSPTRCCAAASPTRLARCPPDDCGDEPGLNGGAVIPIGCCAATIPSHHAARPPNGCGPGRGAACPATTRPRNRCGEEEGAASPTRCVAWPPDGCCEKRIAAFPSRRPATPKDCQIQGFRSRGEHAAGCLVRPTPRHAGNFEAEAGNFVAEAGFAVGKNPRAAADQL